MKTQNDRPSARSGFIPLYDDETGAYVATVPAQTAQRIYRHGCLLESIDGLEKAANRADGGADDRVYDAYLDVCEAMVAYLFGYEDEYDYAMPRCEASRAIARAIE